MILAIIATVTGVVAALAAAAAAVWAGRELHLRRIGDLEERAAEIEATTLSFRLLKPRRSEVRDGTGDFVYTFTLHNPGRFPITEATVELTYPGEVCRIHNDAAGTMDSPRKIHDMFAAAVAGRDSHSWTRCLRVQEALWPRMRQTTATITFTTPDAGRIQLPWPAVPSLHSPELRRRIRQQFLVTPDPSIGSDKRTP